MNNRMFRRHEPYFDRLNNRLIYVTVGMTLYYLLVSVIQTLLGARAATPFLHSSLTLHPGSLILMCSVVAAIGVAFMPEIGKIFAAVALLAILALFAYWGYVSNWFIGATIFDLVMLPAAAVALVYDIQVICKNLQSPTKKEPLRNTPQPVMTEVPKLAKVAK